MLSRVTARGSRSKAAPSAGCESRRGDGGGRERPGRGQRGWTCGGDAADRVPGSATAAQARAVADEESAHAEPPGLNRRDIELSPLHGVERNSQDQPQDEHPLPGSFRELQGVLKEGTAARMRRQTVRTSGSSGIAQRGRIQLSPLPTSVRYSIPTQKA
jgi:hypothetical protein